MIIWKRNIRANSFESNCFGNYKDHSSNLFVDGHYLKNVIVIYNFMQLMLQWKV